MTPIDLGSRVQAVIEKWHKRYKAVCSVLDRCDAARAYEIQNFLSDLDALVQASAVSSQTEKSK